MFCGNGGSAADAQHLAAEYVVRLAWSRPALPALALTTDTSVLTACANDRGYDEVFARQVAALGRPGDLLVIHSTSGDSANLIKATSQARQRGMTIVGLLAGGGGQLNSLVDVAVLLPTERVSRAQEGSPCDRAHRLPLCGRVSLRRRGRTHRRPVGLRRTVEPLNAVELRLRGKRALVTGGSRGVGAATVRLLAGAGADVGISYHSRSAEADRVVDEARAMGVGSWAEGGDLADRAAVDRLFNRVDREFGSLDIFVGNAGIWPVADVPLAEMDDARWQRTIAVNLDSIFFTTREALCRMNDDGRVILVSSTAGQRGEAYHADYAATKGAMISMVKGLCVEVGGRGITVNAVGARLDRHRDVPGRAGQ